MQALAGLHHSIVPPTVPPSRRVLWVQKHTTSPGHAPTCHHLSVLVWCLLLTDVLWLYPQKIFPTGTVGRVPNPHPLRIMALTACPGVTISIGSVPKIRASFSTNPISSQMPAISPQWSISCTLISYYAAKPDKIALPLFLIFLSHLISISPSFNNLCNNSDNSSTDLNRRCAIYSFAECPTN